ncbi:MAG: hypothetical protein H9W81_07935 [Enterococcus sp.]|nr:hypothetical protein [Enterococcus sp.]
MTRNTPADPHIVCGILDMYGLIDKGRAEREELLANVMWVLDGHDRATLNGRSSEAFQGVSEYIAEVWDDNLAFGSEVACYLFYALDRFDELGPEKQFFKQAHIEHFVSKWEEYRKK